MLTNANTYLTVAIKKWAERGIYSTSSAVSGRGSRGREAGKIIFDSSIMSDVERYGSDGGASAAPTDCLVYRLKRNPTWVRFGLCHRNNAKGSATSQTCRSPSQSGGSSSVMEMARNPINTVAAAGAEEALRYEGRHRPKYEPSIVSRAEQSNATRRRTVEHHHDPFLSCHSGIRVALSPDKESPWRGNDREARRNELNVPPQQRRPCCRGAASHLSGSAALVEADGPLDALYIPLRRPAPGSCSASTQNWSICGEGGKQQQQQQRRKKGGGSESTASTGVHQLLQYHDRSIYTTSNSAYGGQGTA